MSEMLFILCMCLYIMIGFFVVIKLGIESVGEVLACLILLWPALIIGKLAEILLTKIGLYTNILRNIFIVIISLLVLLMIFLSVKGLCIGMVNIGQ